jgi:translation initiation factor 1 (eIF-1/SUI1)
MRTLRAVLLLLCLVGLSNAVRAGDAVVVGYNPDGMWTAITYYRSSTPKGGHDYKDIAGAREEALRDLRKRAGENMVMSKVLADSDSTGYVAVARAEKSGGKDVTVVAHADSQDEADKKALADLRRAGAMKKQKVVYRFFSYGSDSAPKSD